MDVNVPLIRKENIQEILSNARDAQLESMASLYGLDYEALSKEDLLNKLEDLLFEKELLEEVLFKLNFDELELYMRIGKSEIDAIPAFEFEYVYGLMNQGLLFPGAGDDLVFMEKVWDVSETILTKDFLKHIKLYDDVEKFAVSMVNLYGIVHANFFTSVYKAFVDEECQERKLLIKLKNVIDEGIVEYQDGFIFSREIGSHFEELYEIIKTKSWYLPTKDELLRYEHKDHYEQTLFTDAIWEILDERTNAQNAEEIVVFMQRDIKYNGFDGELVNAVLEEFKLEFNAEDDFNEFLAMTVEMANHTRQWRNLGYKPTELEQIS